jgi:hypothetical protein
MERWAANTLRTLGIILTAGFVLITSLILLLFSVCAANGGIGGYKHPELVVPYLVAAALVIVVGCFVILRLARGISRFTALSETTLGALSHSEPTSSLPLHLSPLGRQAIDRLIYALAAQIVLSAASLTFDQMHFFSTHAPAFPRNWTLVLIVSFILSHAPYGILIYVLHNRPDRRAFAYSLAVPAVLLLESLFGVMFLGRFFVHQPMGFVVLGIPWLIHIVIIVLAYQAIQQVGLHPEPASLIVAAIVAFVFFSVVHAITPFLYRFAR